MSCFARFPPLFTFYAYKEQTSIESNTKGGSLDSVVHRTTTVAGCMGCESFLPSFHITETLG